MEIAAYLQFMLLCIFILGLIFYHAIHGVSRGKSWRLFIGAVGGALFCQLFELFWGLTDLGVLPVSIGVHRFICSLYYSSVIALSLWWFYYSEYTMDSLLLKTKGGIFLSALPYLLMNLLLLLPSENGIFYIDSNNTYHRGRLYFLCMFFSYGYLLVTASRALWKAANKNNFAKRKEYLVVASFVIYPCLFGGIQVFVPNMSLINIGIVLAVVQVYLVSQETLISLDPLTRLNNRNQLLKYLSGKMKTFNRKNQLYLLIMDVDNFKAINDKMGHVAGDNTLVRIAETLKQYCAKKDYFVSRYGGDEFIMICETETQQEIKNLCDQIEQELADYSIHLSIGFALYTEEIQNIPDFIEKADKELYKVKNERRSKSC